MKFCTLFKTSDYASEPNIFSKVMTENLKHKHDILSQLDNHLDKQEQFLDSFIDAGSEQDLFITSYIHGHFSVVAANFLKTIHASSESHLSCFNESDVLKSFNSELKSSIDQAIAKGELEQKDIRLVRDKLNQLFQL